MIRLRPRTVRARIALLIAALFLGAGAVLLGVTYALVDHSLPTPNNVRAVGNNQAKAVLSCKQLVHTPSPKVPPATTATSSAHPAGAEPQRSPDLSFCKQVFAAGAAEATSSQRAQTLDNLLLFSLLGLGIMTLLSGALGWLVAGRVLVPVRRITEAARSASHEHFERLELAGPDDELKELADTFDEMLARLDAAFAGQRRFVADASHELRTPLTVMRTAIDVALAKPERSVEQLEAMATKVRRAVERAQSLVDALLTLASGERELIAAEEVDLATLAEDALDDLRSAIEAAGLTVEAELDAAPVRGDRVLLDRVLGNLLDNAARHNRPGGSLHIATGIEDGAAVVEISNTGVPIAPELVEELFEPFRRVEERTNVRDGVGLGLAIVKAIVTAHGGSVAARADPGGGLTVTLRFPAVTAASREPAASLR